MKQLTFKMAIPLVCIVGVFLLFAGGSEKNKMNDLAFSNIEVLASGEGGSTAYCYGYGSIDCPSGTKAEYVITGLKW
jgi:hypothetical protein